MRIEFTKKEKQNLLIILPIFIIGALGYCTFKKWLEIKDLITIIALFMGPVVAVIITRYNDQIRAKKERQLMTFRALMQNRSDPVSKEFVAALNLIEVDFNEHLALKNAWKELFEALHPKVKPEKPDEISQQLLLWQTLTTKLLHELGKYLNIEIEQLDIMQRVYAPQGWLNEKNRDTRILENVDVLLAKAAWAESQLKDLKLVNDSDPALIDILYKIIHGINARINEQKS